MSTSLVPMVITYYGIAAMITGFASYAIAAAKYRNASNWGFWGFVFPPSLLITLLLPKLSLEKRRERRIAKVIEERLAERDDD